MQTSSTDLGGMLRKHATTAPETPQDFTRLPGGIDDGRAQLVVATIGVFKTGNTTGQKFIRLAANVVEPVMVLEIKRVWDKDAPDPRNHTKKGAVKIVGQRERKVSGLQTSQMLPLCASNWDDVKKEFATSMDDNVKTAMSVLNLCAGCDERTPQDQIFTRNVVDEASLEEVLKHLESAAPYIKFTTSDLPPSDKFPEPKVFEKWYGSKGLENYSPPAVGAAVQKTVIGVNSPNGGSANGPTTPTHEGMMDGKAAVANVMQTMQNGHAGDADGALLELLSLCKQQLPDAQEQMLNLAVEAGVTQDVLDGTDDWQVVYDAIVSKRTPATTPPAAPTQTQPAAASGPDPSNPKVGDRFFYKMSKAMPRGVEVEVTIVNADGSTKAKNISNPKMEFTVAKGRLDKTANG